MGAGLKRVRIGVHLSIKNGFVGALRHALELGCDGFQMFIGNPRGWMRKPLDPQAVAEFRKQRKMTDIWPVVVHLAYLPNLAAADDRLYQQSVFTLAADFRHAICLGADFLVFHPGKTKESSFEQGAARVADAVNLVLEEIDGPTLLLFENQAGAGTEIAGHFEQLGALLGRVNHPERTGVCLDTCHAYAAGYNLATPDGWEETIREFQREIGLSALKLLHLNDSLGKLGSALDRHQHIGAGAIGAEGFQYLVNHPRLGKLPGILETPQQQPGDDLRNLNVLREMMRK